LRDFHIATADLSHFGTSVLLYLLACVYAIFPPEIEQLCVKLCSFSEERVRRHRKFNAEDDGDELAVTSHDSFCLLWMRVS